MNKKKVAVLMSTYNGVQYVSTQIDSIINQTYQNIEIIVRDDGSTDGTIDILRQYKDQGIIQLEEGHNIGFIQSFFWLISHSPKADYYAFSDQDDKWKKDKIDCAVNMLEKEEQNIPVLYFSNYTFCDGDMNVLTDGVTKGKDPSFANALLDCMPLGISVVYNQSAQDIVQHNIPRAACGHDWWMYMICQSMGKVVFDKRSTLYYRRHSKNVSPGGKSFLNMQIWRFKKFFMNGYFENIHNQIREFMFLYENQLSENDRKLISYFAIDKYRICNVCKKLLYRGRYRQNITDELFVRIIILIGLL